jgi:hypothetical protein
MLTAFMRTVLVTVGSIRSGDRLAMRDFPTPLRTMVLFLCVCASYWG